MELISLLAKFIVSAAGISAIVIYIGKRFIDKSLDLGLEKFKSNLANQLETHKSELSKQTEEFKSNLKKLELEHQIKFNKLHEERAGVIKKMYNLLINLQADLSNFTSMFQGAQWKTETHKEAEARRTLDEFKRFFLTNRIYFSIDLCTMIDTILNQSWDVIVDMSSIKMEAQGGFSGVQGVKLIQDWRDLNSRVSKEINTARLNLENEFRIIIGVS